MIAFLQPRNDVGRRSLPLLAGRCLSLLVSLAVRSYPLFAGNAPLAAARILPTA